jgi:hypothetical protein
MPVRKQGDWPAAEVGDELVMMSAEKGNYIGLSEVGAPETCRAEVRSFLEELVKHGATAFNPPPAA